MSEKKSGEQQAEEQPDERRELEYLANFAREYFGGMPAGHAETVLTNCSPHLRCVAARSLLAQHEGPLTEGQVQLILEIATDENQDQIEHFGFSLAKKHQVALLQTLLSERLGELTDEHRERVIDTCLEQGFDGKLLLPLATETISSETIDKMIGAHSGSLLRNRLIEQVGGRLSRQQINDIIDAEIAAKRAAVELVSSRIDLEHYDEPDSRRAKSARAGAEAHAGAEMHRVLSALARHEDIFLSPIQIRKLTEHGNGLVHLDLISHRGHLIRPLQRDQILAETSPKYLLTSLVNEGAEMPEWGDDLIDAVVADIKPTDWRSREGLDEKHTAHFSAKHIDALIDGGNSEFVFQHVLRDHPEKLLPEHADRLLRNHGQEIREGWMKLIGKHLTADRVNEIVAVCRDETALAFVINYPDKFSTAAERVDTVFTIYNALTGPDRYHSNYLNSKDFIVRFGTHLSPSRIDELIEEGHYTALSHLLRNHSDKVSDEQLQRFFDTEMEHQSSFHHTIGICGRQLLERVDGLIDKLLATGSSSSNLRELVKTCADSFTPEQIDQLLSSAEGLTLIGLAGHCLPIMPSDRIDRLLELGSSRRLGSESLWLSAEETEERILEAAAEHGHLLSPAQITKVIETDRLGTATAKLLADHHHRLEPGHLDAIVWKFGHLDTADLKAE